MRRRDFISAIAGSAAAWPLEVRAQQPASFPVIGFLGTLSEAQAQLQVGAFRRGLGEVGFAQGRNLGIEFRWAEGQYDRLPGSGSGRPRRKPRPAWRQCHRHDVNQRGTRAKAS